MSESTLREQLKARQLLPHQVEFVELALDSMPGGRILLADDVGLGKTHACIALAWALTQKLGREPRVLVLAPYGLIAHLKAKLEEAGVGDARIVDAAAYRRLEARTVADENPWGSVNMVVASIDFAKREDRIDALVEAPWDLVILEESHLATSRSQRGRVLRALWGSDLVGLMVAVSATPHTGYAEDLRPFTAPATRVLRRRRRDLVDWDGNALIPDSAEQIVEVVPLELSPEERELYEAVARFAEESSADDRPRHFLTQTVARTAMSSLFALEGTARRSLAKANLAAHGDGAQSALFEDDSTAEEYDDLLEEDRTFEPVPQPMDRAELQALLDLIDRVEVDTKWLALAEVLRPAVVGTNGSAVIFSDFAATAAYLAELLHSTGCPVAKVEGRQTDAYNRQQYERFRNEGGVLVATSASEGLNLSFVKLCIHYDIPWNAARMAQRLGRVHRYGATPGAVRHVAFSDEILVHQAMAQKLLSVSEPDPVPDILDELGLLASAGDQSSGDDSE